MQSQDLKCNICLPYSLCCSLGFNQLGQQWLSDYFYLGDRKSARFVRQLEPREIVRGWCRNIVRVRRNVMANMTNISRPRWHNKQNTKSSPHHTIPLTSNHYRQQNIISTGWHLHDFLRRWDLMSLFEFFAGTKIQVKLSGSAPWGIQSLCLTYNAIIERMFFRESAQTIQRLRVGFAVRPP